ncbi:hypothetical protein CJI50_00230 [Bifidobacteriaceae bacterium NR021]|nr:hypothetical protein CJI50_00230 [Bifidobacteriaceae bacterium NR021]
MLKKKTIAAFAAAATLLAGCAFAAPAMADDEIDTHVIEFGTPDPLSGENLYPETHEAPANPKGYNDPTQVPDMNHCYKNALGTVVCEPATKTLYNRATTSDFHENDKKPAPAPVAPAKAKLPKTGAAVAVIAVVASALAGMGTALRKIRH